MDDGCLILCVLNCIHCAGLGVLGHLSYFPHHGFDWLYDQLVDVFRKKVKQKDQNDANKYSSGDREVCINFNFT